jgi:hypothetical protein
LSIARQPRTSFGHTFSELVTSLPTEPFGSYKLHENLINLKDFVQDYWISKSSEILSTHQAIICVAYCFQCHQKFASSLQFLERRALEIQLTANFQYFCR